MHKNRFNKMQRVIVSATKQYKLLISLLFCNASKCTAIIQLPQYCQRLHEMTINPPANIKALLPILILLSASANKMSKLKERAKEYAALIMEELDPENLVH
ncbi:uncharacterized protein LOC141706126 isoform X2 [Apium graveolens]|uniref:uncharacterized protein LOC141675006 isoform X2 n=1 Tax=Apium graveolens TaxID=4045 RepID=UPI003D7B78F3